MAAEVTDERIAAAAARLHDGGWWFTTRQLYYSVCADVETPPVRIARGEVGLGMILVLVGAITGNRTALLVLGGVGALLLLLGAYTHLQERRPPPLSRLLAISFAEFEQRLQPHAHQFAGLVDASTATTVTAGRDDLGSSTAADVSADAVTVVCDRLETAALLRANAERLGGMRVLARDQQQEDLRGRRVVALHDCDPLGCALAADLRDSGAVVGDAGINPAELIGKRLQLIEGAPARLPRELAGHLAPDEIDWLRSGRRVELATLTPEQLVMRVRAAVAP